MSGRAESQQVINGHLIGRPKAAIQELEAPREKIKNALHMYRRVFERTKDASIIFSTAGKVVEVNGAASELFGYTRDEMTSLRYKDLAVGGPELRKAVVEVLEEGRIEDVELRFKSRVGAEVICQVTASTLDHPHGRKIGYLAVLRNLSERRKEEQAMAFLAAIVESASDSIVSVGLDGQVLTWNKGAETLFGYTAIETVGRPAPTTGPGIPDDREELLSRAAGGEVIREHVTQRIAKDGSAKDVALTVSPIRDKNGVVLAHSAIARDITFQKQAEKRLSDSEQRYRSLFENIRDAIFMSSPDRLIIDANQAASELFGYTRQEMTGMSVADLFQQSPELDEAREELRTSGFVKDFEVVCRRKDGSLLKCLTTVSQRRDDEGGIMGYQTIVRDVTEQRKAEESLSHLAAVVHSSQDAIISFDLDGRILSWNPGAEGLLGYGAKEVIGRLTPNGQSDGATGDWSELRERLLRGEKAQGYETKWATKYGRVIDVSITLSPLGDRTGKATAISGIVRDVTEQKKREKALREAGERYRRLFENIRDAIFISGSDRRIAEANDAACELFGYSRPELVGMEVSKLVAPGVSTDGPRRLLHEQGYLKDLEIRLRRRDGTVIDCLQSVSVWKDERGGVLGYQNIIRNVTEKRQAQEVLSRLAAVVEYSEDAISSFASDGTTLTWNAGAERLYGYKREEVIGKTPYLPTPEGEPDDRARLRERVMKGESIMAHETRRITKDGRTIDISLTYSPIRDAQGAIVAIAGIARDITEKKKAERAIAQLAAIVESSDDAIVTISLETQRPATWNKGAENLFGYAYEEVKDRPLGYLTPPGALDDREDRFSRVAKGEIIRGIDTQRITKEGRLIDVSMTMSPVRDSAGKVVASLSVSRDITEIKQRERALLVAEDRYRRLFEDSMDAISLASRDGIILEANQAFLGMFEYSKEDLKSLKAWQLFKNPKVRDENVEVVTQKGFIKDKDVKLRRKDGTEIDCQITSTRLRDNRGEFIGFQSIYRDVTERNRAERTRSYLAAIVESSTDSISSCDLDGRILTWNQGAEALYGFTAEEAIGSLQFPVIPEEVDDERPESFGRVAMGESLKNEELQRKTKDGRNIYVSRTLSPIRDADGKVVAIASIVRDVTDRKRAEVRLRESSRLASIGELASGIAHEINNPLASVSGFAELLMEQDLPSQIARDISRIHSEAQRAAKIVHSLLSFARRQQPEKGIVDLSKTLEIVLSLKAYDLRMNNIKVVKTIDRNIPPFVADGQQLTQVFLNIITNAEQAMAGHKSGGKLEIKATRDGEKVRITFTDDGPGIPREILDRIFDPFFTTKEVGRGTGLGLSMCYGFIKAHAGDIWAESVLGKGATFYVELPLARLPGNPQSESPALPQNGTREKVLVIDDELPILEFMSRGLTKMGYQVDVARDGPSAWSTLSQKAYDIILIALKMPGQSGQELYNKLMEKDPEASRRVIFVTGDALGEKTQTFMRSAKRPWIEKPLTLTEAHKCIQELLQDVVEQRR